MARARARGKKKKKKKKESKRPELVKQSDAFNRFTLTYTKFKGKRRN